MKLKNKKWWANHGATILGISMAVLMAWKDVDWENFNAMKEWPGLLLDAGIAIGGWLTKFNVKDEESSK